MQILERPPTVTRAHARSKWLVSLLIAWVTACDSGDDPDAPLRAGARHMEAGVSIAGEQLSAGHLGGVEAGGLAGVVAGVEAGLELMGGLLAGERPPHMSGWTTAEIFEGLSPTCAPCHSAGQSTPAFENLTSFERLIVADPAWVTPGSPDESELLVLLSGSSSGRYAQMPPSGLSYQEREATLSEQTPRAPTMIELADWIRSLSPDALITPPEEVSCATLPAQSGLSRLSRADYQRAVEDLLGTSLQIARDLPAEHES